MRKLLKLIHSCLRRKLKELKPEFISIVVMVPKDIHRDLVDEYQSKSIGDSILSFSKQRSIVITSFKRNNVHGNFR